MLAPALAQHPDKLPGGPYCREFLPRIQLVLRKSRSVPGGNTSARVLRTRPRSPGLDL